MSLFVDIVSLVGSAASISGVSLRDFISKKQQLSSADKLQIELFLRFLEARNVLFAGMDDEVHLAVLRSLEEIKRETDDLRQRCGDEHVDTILLNLLLVMSKKLQTLHALTAQIRGESSRCT